MEHIQLSRLGQSHHLDNFIMFLFKQMLNVILGLSYCLLFIAAVFVQ